MHYDAAAERVIRQNVPQKRQKNILACRNSNFNNYQNSSLCTNFFKRIFLAPHLHVGASFVQLASIFIKNRVRSLRCLLSAKSHAWFVCSVVNAIITIRYCQQFFAKQLYSFCGQPNTVSIPSGVPDENPVLTRICGCLNVASELNTKWKLLKARK